MSSSELTCQAFDAALSDYLEGTLDGQMREQVEQHLRECVRCTSLTRDLEKIQSDAAALPDLAPARDLWAGIEARIAAPVIPLAARPEKQRRFAPAWMGVAAAALVVSTAGVTYLLTARSLDQRGNATLATVAQQTPGSVATSDSQPGSASVAGPATPDNSAPRATPNTGFVRVPSGRSPAIPANAVSRNLQAESAHSEQVYGKEIALLQTIVSQKKTQLDPSTVAIIEKNLQIIDAAIEQSRAALARDPASMLLSQQLTHALDKKIELLRTAAMLPTST
jgi:hypothetical protein